MLLSKEVVKGIMLTMTNPRLTPIGYRVSAMNSATITLEIKLWTRELFQPIPPQHFWFPISSGVTDLSLELDYPSRDLLFHRVFCPTSPFVFYLVRPSLLAR